MSKYKNVNKLFIALFSVCISKFALADGCTLYFAPDNDNLTMLENIQYGYQLDSPEKNVIWRDHNATIVNRKYIMKNPTFDKLIKVNTQPISVDLNKLYKYADKVCFQCNKFSNGSYIGVASCKPNHYGNRQIGYCGPDNTLSSPVYDKCVTINELPGCTLEFEGKKIYENVEYFYDEVNSIKSFRYANENSSESHLIDQSLKNLIKVNNTHIDTAKLFQNATSVIFQCKDTKPKFCAICASGYSGNTQIMESCWDKCTNKTTQAGNIEEDDEDKHYYLQDQNEDEYTEYEEYDDFENTAPNSENNNTIIDASKPTSIDFKTLDKILDTHFSKTSMWKDKKGDFNTARLISDSVAGVILGTIGGVVTSNIIKKNQIKTGFENLKCTINGQDVANYGDEFNVNVQ